MRRFVLPGLFGAAAILALFACSASSDNGAFGRGAQGGDSSDDGSGPSGTGSGTASSAHTGSGGASTGTSMTSSTGSNSGGASTGTSMTSSTGSNSGGASNTSSTGSNGTTSSSGITSSSGSGGGNPDCPPEGTLVYTLDVLNNLYTFDPPSLTFTLVGTLNCPSFFSPYSMAVSRNGTAYVIFQDGNLFMVDTKTANCTSTSFVPSQHGFTTFGMGFSANSPGSMDETLFVSQSDVPSLGLGKIDLQTFVLTPINVYNTLDVRAELTGTGDAKLFGAFEGSPYNVAEIDKTNAKILSQAPQNVINYPPNSSNFAFAYWGGDFYLFVGPGGTTDVFHYQPANQMTAKVKTVNFEIVGAGVSTCAPTHM